MTEIALLNHNATDLLGEEAGNHPLATRREGDRAAARVPCTEAIAPVTDPEKRGDPEQVVRGGNAGRDPSRLLLAGRAVLGIVSGIALLLTLPASEKLATTAIPPIRSAAAPDEVLSLGAGSTTLPKRDEFASIITSPRAPISTSTDPATLLEPPPVPAATLVDADSAVNPNIDLSVTTRGSPARADETPRSTAEISSALIARGDALFGTRDIISARLFYERAADSGNELAAVRLGETYDPDFLAQTRLPAGFGDLAKAAFWYRRANELGSKAAGIALNALETKIKR